MSTLIVGSVALVTAVAYWQDRLGYSAVAVVGGTGTAAFLALIALPERFWNRLVGTDLLLAELGELHAEGALLRTRLPWVPDDAPDDLAEWVAEAEDWFERVQKRLHGTPWLGTLLSPIARGLTVQREGYAEATKHRIAMDDKLERLSQVIATLGKRQ